MGDRSNLDLTVVFYVSNAETIMGNAFFTKSVDLADDAVVSIAPPTITGGIIAIWAENVDQIFGLVWFRATGTHLIRNMGALGASVDWSTTALSGTTGTDGRVTASCNNDIIEIENRSDASRQFGWAFLSRWEAFRCNHLFRYLLR